MVPYIQARSVELFCRRRERRIYSLSLFVSRPPHWKPIERSLSDRLNMLGIQAVPEGRHADAKQCWDGSHT